MTTECDVVVMGGGPAGSTISTLPATPIRRGLLFFRALYYLESVRDIRRALNIRDESAVRLSRG